MDQNTNTNTNTNSTITENEKMLLAKFLEKEEKRREYRRSYNQRIDVKMKHSQYHRDRNEVLKFKAEKFDELVALGIIDEDGEVIEKIDETNE